jgi:hypothetical protein
MSQPILFLGTQGIKWDNTRLTREQVKAWDEEAMHPLYWCRILDEDILEVFQIVDCTHAYALLIWAASQSAKLNPHHHWPPDIIMITDWKFSHSQADVYSFIALFIYMGFQRTTGSEGLWSRDFFWKHKGVHQFMSFKCFKQIKFHDSLSEPLHDPDLQGCACYKTEAFSTTCLHHL